MKTNQPTVPIEPCPRCGCEEATDTPIHDGQSIRRDCAHCGHLIDFPRWHEERVADVVASQLEGAS